MLHLFEETPHKYAFDTDAGVYRHIDYPVRVVAPGVVCLDHRRKAWQWIGVIACRSCSCCALVRVELDGGPEVPHELPCPRCTSVAETSTNWSAAWRLRCACNSKEIQVVFSDMLPVAIVECSCGVGHPTDNCEDFLSFLIDVTCGDMDG